MQISPSIFQHILACLSCKLSSGQVGGALNQNFRDESGCHYFQKRKTAGISSCTHPAADAASASYRRFVKYVLDSFSYHEVSPFDGKKTTISPFPNNILSAKPALVCKALAAVAHLIVDRKHIGLGQESKLSRLP